MYAKIRKLKSKRILLIVLALMCGITVATASAKYWAREEVTPGKNLSTQVSSSQKQPNSKPSLTLLPIQIRSTGFARAELSAPAGNVELYILNASGEPDITVQLERENDHSKKPETLKNERARPVRKKLHLSPGVYLLKVVEHPDWVCRLNITEPEN